ncbi:MAG: molybdate ABC transporter substrate-binding protein [Gaiellaceae bacterium]
MIFGLGGAAVKLTVFAAASLTSAFPQIDHSQRYSFAGSDQLAFQIQQGAPADVFASANTKYPDQLYAQGFVEKPKVFATNELVLIVPRDNEAGIHSVYDLQQKGLRIVIAAQGVPAGDYTRKALAALGLSSVLKSVVSEETDVKGVVAKVALGEADAGFVYRTDALAAVRDVYGIKLPAAAQPVIRYELAVVKTTHHLYAARKFAARVLSTAGRLALARAGFGLP